MKLCLGTAQLGNVYGFSNKTPALDYATCRDIVHTAYMNNVRYFDTSPAYGPANEYLERALQEIEATEAKIIAKMLPKAESCQGWTVIGGGTPYALLCHGFLPGPIAEYGKRPYKFGVSIDIPIEAWMALDNPEIDILQVPYNMQQTDMLRPIQAAQEKGIEVMVRSIFMQGKLFDFGCTVKECMDFVHTTLPDCMQVIGAETPEQVEQLCEIARTWDE